MIIIIINNNTIHYRSDVNPAIPGHNKTRTRNAHVLDFAVSGVGGGHNIAIVCLLFRRTRTRARIDFLRARRVFFFFCLNFIGARPSPVEKRRIKDTRTLEWEQTQNKNKEIKKTDRLRRTRVPDIVVASPLSPRPQILFILGPRGKFDLQIPPHDDTVSRYMYTSFRLSDSVMVFRYKTPPGRRMDRWPSTTLAIRARFRRPTSRRTSLLFVRFQIFFLYIYINIYGVRDWNLIRWISYDARARVWSIGKKSTPTPATPARWRSGWCGRLRPKTKP